MNSALQGSIAVHTILIRPEDAAATIQFYRDRQRETVALHSKLSAQYYSESRFACSGAFWKRRATAEPNSFPADPERSRILFSDLRLSLSHAARFVPTPCITGDFITNIAALAHPQLERPVAYLNKIEASILFDSIPQDGTVADITRAWSLYFSRSDSLGTLDWLVRMGVLVPTQ